MTHLQDPRPLGVAAGLHLMVELGDSASELQIIEPPPADRYASSGSVRSERARRR